MRLLLIGLAACSTVDAAAPAPSLLERRVLFADNDQIRLSCWTSRPHVTTTRSGDLQCRVTATEHIDHVRATRLVCDDVAATIPALAKPMPDGWFVVERDVGTWHLGYGRDRDRPLRPQFGWQNESAIDKIVLDAMHREGPDFPEAPVARTWEAWANDDYALSRRTRENGASWCTQTTLEGVGGLPTRHEVCWRDGIVTGASVTIFLGWLGDPRCANKPTIYPLCDQLDPRTIVDEPDHLGGWTMQTRCGDAPALYVDSR